jgi:hypothetical protein
MFLNSASRRAVFAAFLVLALVLLSLPAQARTVRASGKAHRAVAVLGDNPLGWIRGLAARLGLTKEGVTVDPNGRDGEGTSLDPDGRDDEGMSLDPNGRQ